jgi:Rrf2 family protein
MLTKKAKYGLHAVLHLARQYREGPVLISDLAREESIPRKFLELILLQLKNHGVLASKKGRGGGYFLSRPPAQVFLGEVVRVLDGPLAPLPCVSRTAYRKCDECVDEQACGIRGVMQRVRDANARILDGTSLADVVAAVKRASRARKRP